MIDKQMELSLDNGRGWTARAIRPTRQSRAQQWFARMREAVDGALDWQPTPPPRPEQTWFTATHPHAQPAPKRDSVERHMCE